MTAPLLTKEKEGVTSAEQYVPETPCKLLTPGSTCIGTPPEGSKPSINKAPLTEGSNQYLS